ncbi:hypothetical protein IM755_12710 [Flavobacterium aquaticum]|uniref:Uncharacterized protein n=1 Tax=Flavobacterium proteolyticum TaxID=2911683 RepID=A0ABR9WV74_9FLAO|nr:hypothetical protein [Flavobacterium proteolyticum]
MKEKIYKYSAFSFVIINFITLYLFYDYFTEKPLMFHGLGIIINFFRLIVFSVGLGLILLLARIFFHLKKRKNYLQTNFLYVFSAIFGINLLINWVICIFMELIRFDFMLNLIILALFLISVIISIDIFKSNFKSLK